MYKLRGRQRNRRWRLWLVIAIIILLIGAAWGVGGWYYNGLRPVSSSQATTYFTIERGQSITEIAENLKSAGLIRSPGAFETYVKAQRQPGLQAGTYTLSPSMSVQQIVEKLIKGQVTKNLLTILPAKRLDQIKQAFIKAGYSSAEVNAAFEPNAHLGHAALAGLPNGSSLEGFLYPDSFQKDSGTPAATIVSESLDEMAKHLTKDIKQGFARQHLSIYQGVTLASIVVQETGNPEYQPSVAQVFLSRLARGMRLQSNVTANYAADIAGQPRNINIASPYNTYLHDGLPPGPISNVTASALAAVAHPANTDYLYFIAGRDCAVHFSRTHAEHEAAIAKYGLNCEP